MRAWAHGIMDNVGILSGGLSVKAPMFCIDGAYRAQNCKYKFPSRFSFHAQSVLISIPYLFHRILLGGVFNKPRMNSGTQNKGWKRLHDAELYDLYSSSSTVSMIKSTMVSWRGHVA